MTRLTTLVLSCLLWASGAHAAESAAGVGAASSQPPAPATSDKATRRPVVAAPAPVVAPVPAVAVPAPALPDARPAAASGPDARRRVVAAPAPSSAEARPAAPPDATAAPPDATAAQPGAASPVPAAAEPSPAAPGPTRAASPAGLAAPVPAVIPSPSAASAAEPAPELGEAASPEETSQLVGGAPLGNANVNVHIVERKPYTNEGSHELVLYPLTSQLNAKFTRHTGVAAAYAFHAHEAFALQVTPLFNYWSRESTFNQELIDKGRRQAQASTALLLHYGALAGVEVSPVYGKFAFYQGVLGRFTLVLNAGAGVGATRIQIRPEQQANCGGDSGVACASETFGDTGFKFLGSVGAGVRVFLGSRAAFRLEVRDVLYTARVRRVNGCTKADLDALVAGYAAPNEACLAEEIEPDDRNRVQKILEDKSSDVLNNVALFTGFSLLF